MPEKKSQDDLLQKWLGFTQKIYSTLDVDESAKTILGLTLQLTRMKRGFIRVFQDNDSLRFLSGLNDEGRQLNANDFPSATPVVNEALSKKGLQYFTEDTDTEGKPQSGFCIPLLSQRNPNASKVIGVLYADNRQIVPFGSEESDVVEVIAAHAGPALESAILYDVATRDPLTHVYLRHYFESAGLIEWRRTLRHKHPISILVLDLDDFRAFNEQFGRSAGDEILQKTAQILKDICRGEDIICRHGGEEFSVLMPETGPAGARKLATRIFEEAARLNVRRDGEEGVVTFSIGIATYPRCSVGAPQELLALADLALQQAKQAGKNRMVAYEPSLSKAHQKLFH